MASKVATAKNKNGTLATNYRWRGIAARTCGILGLTLLLGACAGLDKNTTAARLEASRVDFARQEFSTHVANVYAQYAAIYQTMYGTQPQQPPQRLAEYTQAGFNYADHKCHEFFRELHRFYKQKRENVAAINLGTGIASGLGAALKAKAAEIAAIAVGGTGAAALVDNRGSSLLFELDPASTEGLVDRARIRYKAYVAAQPPISSLGDAVTAIQGYAAICTPSGIERLVKQAVDTANPDNLADAGGISQAGLDRLRLIVAESMGLSAALPLEELPLLYWLLELDGKSDAKQRAAIHKQLSGSTREKLFAPGSDALRATPADLQVQGRVRGALLGLEVGDPQLRSTALAQQRALLAAEAVAAPAAPTPAPAPAPSRAGSNASAFSATSRAALPLSRAHLHPSGHWHSALEGLRMSILPHLDPSGAMPRPRWQQRLDDVKKKLLDIERMPGLALAPPAWQTLGDHLGLCLPVEFPDMPGHLTQAQIDAFCNLSGFHDFGNNGSVFDYFHDVSRQKLRYSTVVAPYCQAKHPRGHYLDPAVPYGQRARELLQEALAFHQSQGFDFGRLSVDGGGAVRATNVFYAGPAANKHGEGLWPHASSLAEPGFDLGGGIRIRDYQITSMGQRLALGVYCHENGHMLCDFPDLYEYAKNRRAGCGRFCLMCFGATADELNPTHVSGYLKFKAGWCDAHSLVPGQTFQAPAGANRVFIHSLPGRPTEYFLLEYRAMAGRDAALPDEGLAIWHVDELGSNTKPHEAAAGHQHYECLLLQADARGELEAGGETGTEGDDTDLFATTDQPLFAPGGPPWWDGKPSGLQISSIRSVGNGIEFTVS